MKFGKALLSITFLIFTAQTAFSQYTITPVWQKIRHSPLSGGWTDGWGVDVDVRGNVYWPVSFDSTANNHLYNIYVYKYDSTGRTLWKSYYAGTGLHDAFVCNASDTNLYVGGIENTVSPYFKSAAHMLFMKLDTATGAILKHANINFGDIGGYDEVDDIVPEKDALYSAGWAQVNGGNGVGVMGYLKVDRNFNVITKTILGDTTVSDESHDDGHIVVDSTYVFGCGMWEGNHSVENLYNGQKIVTKFNRTGLTFVDSATFGAHLSGCLEDALGCTSDGKYIYVTGYSNPITTGDLQLFLAKFDKSLNLKWIKYFGGAGGEEARSIKVHNGLVFIGGASNTPAYAPHGGYDAILLIYDTAGNYRSCGIYGDAKDNEFRDMAIQGHYIYLSGNSGTNMFSLGGSSDSAFLIKVDINSLVIGIPEKVSGNKDVKVYPTPGKGQLTIEMTASEKEFFVEFYDVLGEKISSYKLNSQLNKLDLSNNPDGIYFYRVYTQSGDFLSGGKFVIQK